jgi:hypothetical protein
MAISSTTKPTIQRDHRQRRMQVWWVQQLSMHPALHSWCLWRWHQKQIPTKLFIDTAIIRGVTVQQASHIQLPYFYILLKIHKLVSHKHVIASMLASNQKGVLTLKWEHTSCFAKDLVGSLCRINDLVTCDCIVFCRPCLWQLCGLRVDCLTPVHACTLLVLYVYDMSASVFAYIPRVPDHSITSHFTYGLTVVCNDLNWFDSFWDWC